MEDVEGMLKGLKLSEVERRGIKIGQEQKEKGFAWAPDDP